MACPGQGIDAVDIAADAEAAIAGRSSDVIENGNPDNSTGKRSSVSSTGQATTMPLQVLTSRERACNRPSGSSFKFGGDLAP